MELPPRHLHQPLNISQTETLLLPQTCFSEDEATRLPCQKRDIILDNSLFLPNTPAQTLSLVDPSSYTSRKVCSLSPVFYCLLSSPDKSHLFIQDPAAAS